MDENVRRVAKARLAFALAHSDDANKRMESRSIATDLVTLPDAVETDYELCFAIHRSHGEDGVARKILYDALKRFDCLSHTFVQKAYTFATETGDVEIRRTLDALEVAEQ